VAYQHDRPVYSARDSYHEGQYAAPYPEQYWTGQSAHYPNQSTMTSSTSSNSHYSNPAALAAYEHHYPSQAYHYATQPSPGNPFMTTPLPHAPSPQPGYGYDQYAQAYQPQRPEMLPRSSIGYLPAEMQYSGYPPRPYSVPQNMMQAMMPPQYHLYPPHASPPAPEDKSEKKEKPPAAPPAPPPPTAEEIKKRLDEEAAIQAENIVKALRAMRVEEKASAAAAAEQEQKVQAESDKIALLLAGFEKERLAREEAAAAKAAKEKAEVEAKAAREKELADAATAARENAVKEAATAAAIAKAEHEKKMAEAKAAADAAEAAKKVAEEELKKNAPGPDADKPPLKFTDAVDRSFTLPWHLVKTWKGMETLIRQAFVNIERIGPHVANGHYHLLGPNGEIILPQVWDIVVQPGWDIKMQMWPLPSDPLEVKVNSGIGGSSRSRPQVSGSKSAGKRASVGPAPPPPPPPPPAPAQHASPLPPPMHMPSVFVGHDDHDDPVVEIVEESHSRGRSGSSGGKSSANSSKKKQVPAFTRWMLGGGTRPRPKGAEKPAAGVKVRHIVV
jgi:chemotaxis protein histidine kinase CheA